MLLARKEPSPEVAAILDGALAGSGAVRCVMFSCPSYSIGGNLFAGVYGESVFVRLSDTDRAAIISEGGRPFEPLEGRTLRMYALLPPTVVADGEMLALWLGRSMDFVRGLPKRPRRRSRIALSQGEEGAERDSSEI